MLNGDPFDLKDPAQHLLSAFTPGVYDISYDVVVQKSHQSAGTMLRIADIIFKLTVD